MAIFYTGVYQATSFKKYTPSNNQLPRAYTTFYLTADSTLSIVDKEGNAETSVAFKAGYHPILVQKIISSSAGEVYVMSYEGQQPAGT